MMYNLYQLLYLMPIGLIALWLVGGIKLIKDYRRHSRQSIQRIVTAELMIALFIAGLTVLIVTHGHNFKVPILLVMALSMVELFRLKAFPAR